MIEGRTVLAVIPARGGSKGIPRKNIRSLAGKPLIAWTITTAQQSKYIDKLILSSDDENIIAVAESWGCEVPFVRPRELAMDDTPGIAPVLHAIRSTAPYDYVVLLQPTSPLRTAADIDGCIERCVVSSAHACVTVVEAEQHPNWMYELDANARMKPLLDQGALIVRRQDLPHVYALNGAVYIAQSDWLLRTHSFLTSETMAYPMARERSIDIDTEWDWLVAEAWVRNSEQQVGQDPATSL